MKTVSAGLEVQRLALQDTLDAQLDASARNKMGQFATPTGLAVEILRYAKACLDVREKVRFIDPAMGTGAFYSALLAVFPEAQISAAVGYEIDPHYGCPAKTLWGKNSIDIHLEDFDDAHTEPDGSGV